MRKQKAILAVSLILLLLGIGAWQCPISTPTPESIQGPPASEPSPPSGSIEACARYNDQYIGNATVSATDHEGRIFVAEANGCYYFDDLPPGDYLVTAKYKDASQSMDVTVDEGESIHLDFWLEGPTPAPPSPDTVSCEQAINYVGEKKTVEGIFYVVYKPKVRGKPTFMNCPRPYQSHDFTALIWGENRQKFIDCLGGAAEDMLDQHELRVSGLIELYKGKPEIILTECGQLTVIQ